MGIVVALEVVVETARRRPWRELAAWWLGGAAVLAVALIVFIPQLAQIFVIPATFCAQHVYNAFGSLFGI